MFTKENEKQVSKKWNYMQRYMELIELYYKKLAYYCKGKSNHTYFWELLFEEKNTSICLINLIKNYVN
jgi:hypothetical protein